MTKVLIDYREPKEIVKEFIKKEIKIERTNLISADYVIQTKDLAGNVQSVGIERKTLSDFLNSIIDKRILSQLIQLKENFSIPLLIIEGKENIYQIRNFHPNAIRGMLASIAIDYQIPILYTKTYRDTVSLITVISSRLDKPLKNLSLIKKRKPTNLKEQQEFLVESLPGVGPTLSKSLLKKFKSVKNIFNATEEELKQVEKLGPKKAKEIRQVIIELYK
jgi:ERCC4-type nuclease